jgi:hypothetical protein
MILNPMETRSKIYKTIRIDLLTNLIFLRHPVLKITPVAQQMNKRGSISIYVIEARSRNHCCCEKARSITYSECVCNLSQIACCKHVPHYIVICGPSDCTILFTHYLINGMIKKNVTKHKARVLIFSTNLSETLFIIREILS